MAWIKMLVFVGCEIIGAGAVVNVALWTYVLTTYVHNCAGGC